MGKMSREKGKGGEREAAKELGLQIGAGVSRSQQYKGGQHSADLHGTGSLHVEVKRTERFDLYGAIKQADLERKTDDIPCVLHRRNRVPWVFVCYLDDLRDIAYEIVRLNEEGNERQ